jgi:hypothetical protein
MCISHAAVLPSAPVHIEMDDDVGISPLQHSDSPGQMDGLGLIESGDAMVRQHRNCGQEEGNDNGDSEFHEVIVQQVMNPP